MNRLYFWVGIAFLIYAPVMLCWKLTRLQEEWEFGPHGLPIPLQGEIPGRYPDGTRINFLDQLMLQSGHPELIIGLILGVLLFAIGWFVAVVRKANQQRREAGAMMHSFDYWLRQHRPDKAEVVNARMQRNIDQLTWFPRQQQK